MDGGGKRDKGPLVLLLAVVSLGLLLLLWRSFSPAPEETGPTTAPGGAEVPLAWVDLYFADAQGERLAIERREVPQEGAFEERIRQLGSELAAGPREKGLAPTVPPSASVRSVFLRGDTAFVDFTGQLAGDHPGGAWTETLTVYSIVNTVAANIPGVARVQILLEGKEGESLAGHLVLDRPLAPRPGLLDGRL